MSDPVRRLKTYGRDLSTIPISRVPTDLEKCCFICVNTYKSYRLNLGVGPMNDAVSWAKCMANYGFHIFFLHNPHSRNFLKYLDTFFANTSQHLVVYYVGHGTSVTDLNGDEDDGKDEAFVFDDGVITDDDLIDHLLENKHQDSVLTLVTDACHSGTIWDIQAGNVHGRELPPHIMSVSAASDVQTAKQTMISSQEQGVFTHNLTKILKTSPSATPTEIGQKIKAALKKYQQSFVVGTTSPELLNEPLFTQETA
ncbi:Clan CD, family C14, metacaspase-like cysteine peptidase [Tritrichomonas foetus]|uniref:Clan CD, family C14, metacaspase-like cysteine peptidase n=1 Tax=Tritrichomonas foetus TaxID=1144522 RepID=A0A1J4JV83_9EUKA|nr:Clan CD, family C14, metacaspase-like cysteine peptidase [Tritrichomonas foetus]|eukprot:OHT03063.1 Clan CD, family C14, metacaspase-like cysteine peptidase [Tritrichomonas foetus]